MNNAIALDALYRKIAWRIMPFLMLCYLLALIDRTNVGFAKLQFMSDLGFSEAAFGLGAGIFYLGYLLFEIPSNLMLERSGVRKTLLRIMVLWGICTCALAFMTSPASFAVLRFLLGAAEAGFFPGVILYLTYWVPSNRRAWFTALLMSCPAVAGVVSGLLAGSIMHSTEGWLDMRGWQWLFLIEGAPAVLLGLGAVFLLSDRPQSAGWLTADERAAVTAEVERDRSEKAEHSNATFLSALKDPRFLLLLVPCFALFSSTSTNVFWAPTILRNAGISNVFDIGMLLVIPNAFGLVVQLLVARSSDRHQERYWHVTGCLLMAACGWLLMPFAGHSIVVSVISLTLSIGGTIAAFGPFFSLPPTFLSRAAAPAGIALVTTVGSFAGFVMPLLIGKLTSAAGTLYAGQFCVGGLLVFGALILIGLSRSGPQAQPVAAASPDGPALS